MDDNADWPGCCWLYHASQSKYRVAGPLRFVNLVKQSRRLSTQMGGDFYLANIGIGSTSI